MKFLLKKIDNFLDKITMYRLVFYYLIGLLIAAFVISFFGWLPFSPIALLVSVAIIFAVSWVVNTLLAKFFRAHTNVESVYISAFILALIITPPQVGAFLAYLSLAGWAAALAMASKYVLAIRKKHIFNPVAVAVVMTGLILNQPASWWVGTSSMLVFVLIGGLLMVRKIRRADLVWSFFIMAAISILGAAVLHGFAVLDTAWKVALDTPIFFFAFIMLTEPLTTPPTRSLRIYYGGLVGFLFAAWVHVGGIYSTPELALVVGNLFSYIVSPKQKLTLILKEKIQQSRDVFDLIFTTGKDKVKFRPGQYMEWTLAHEHPDNRGNRRYFTLASSPTEETIRMGVKSYPDSSSFKKKLFNLKPGDEIVASQLAGDFVLPKNPDQKLVFLAGGIGVTPFRSMIKYLLDKNEKRPIVLIYSARTIADLAYKDLFDEAGRRLGIKNIYVTGDDNPILSSTDQNTRWVRAALIDVEMVIKEVPDYKERMFYLSGPHAMVTTFQEVLASIGVRADHIKTDFFPGFV